MDFKPQIKYTLPSGVPLPFFMAYPDYLDGRGLRQENELWKDMEYLRQIYPAKLKKYEKRVEEILDKMDYEGSMIFDEYPDQLGIRMLAEAITKELALEEHNSFELALEEHSSFELALEEDGKAVQAAQQDVGEKCPVDMETLKALVQVLVCQEICRRRSKHRKYY